MNRLKDCPCGGYMVVVDTRDRGDRVYRRRECDCCKKRITTCEVYYELSEKTVSETEKDYIGGKEDV